MKGLKRDSDTNRIVSYTDERASENAGQIEIPVVDERFFSKDFDFIVKTRFTSLKEAADAQSRVFNQIDAIQKSLLRGVPIGSLGSTEIENIKSIAKNELLSDLKNIAENDPTSTDALKQKISALEDIIDSQRDQLNDWATTQNSWQEQIRLWSLEYENQSVRADAFERMNNELSSQQEQILTDLKTQIEQDSRKQAATINALAEKTNDTLSSLAKDVDSMRTWRSDFIKENPESGLSRMSELIKKDYFGTSGTAGTAGGGG